MTRPRDITDRFIHRRPLALAAGCYGCGAAIACQTGAPPLLWLALLAVALLLFAVRRHALAGFIAVIAAGALITAGALLPPQVEPADGALVKGRIIAEPKVRQRDTIVTLDNVSIDGASFPHRLRAYIYDPVDISLGDTISLTGNTWLPMRQTNPGGFDFAMWLWKENVALCASANAGDVSPASDSPPRFDLTLLPARMRFYLGDLIDQLFPRQSPLVRALIIGDKALLPEDLIEDFRVMGVSHVLAVSGLHISCLALALDWLLRRLYASRKAAYLTTLLAVLAYTALVGFPASAVRAALMYALARGAPLTGRPSDGLTGLSAAFLVLLVARPLSITDAGFVLSFSAVAGLMLIAPVLGKVLRADGVVPDGAPLPRKARQAVLSLLCATVAANLGTMPAIATYYGAFSPWSLIGNLFAVPLALAALPLSMLATAIGAVYLPAGQVAAWLPDGMLDLLARGTNWMANLPFSTVALPAWPAHLCFGYALMCFFVSPYVAVAERIRKWLLLGLPAIVCLSVAINLAALPKGFSIVFLDAGQADAAVVHAQRGVHLVDVGDVNSPSDDYLRHYGIARVGSVFLSHPHSDHAAGLGEVIKQVAIDTVYLSSRWRDADVDEGIAELILLAEENGARVMALDAGDEIALSADITATVHQPDAQMPMRNANEGSMVLSIRYGDGSALFTGDLTAAAEKLPMPDSDVLKVAHHGAGGSTSTFQLMTATPSVAVLSAGRNNYGHPSADALERIAGYGAAPYRTDQCGAITVTIEKDGSVAVSTYKTPED